MLIPLAYALALSLSAAAQTDTGGFLRKIAEIPGAGTASKGGTLFASAGDSSISVWRLPEGRVVHRIPLPRIVRRGGDNEWITFHLAEFSSDDRFLLLTSEHNRVGDKGETATYLVDLDKETTRQIHTARGPCFNIHGGIRVWLCPADDASFSPDGKRILIALFAGYLEVREPQGPERYENEALVVDFNGKVLEDFKDVFRQEISPDGSRNGAPVAETTPHGADHPGFAADGHLLGVIVDESACEVRDLTAGTRVSFLDDCKRGADQQLRFVAPGKVSDTGWSCSKDCYARYWDAMTGKVQKLAYGNGGGAAFTASGDYALALLSGGPDKRLELRASPFDRAISSAPTDSDGFYYWSLARNGAYAFQVSGKETIVYETGLHGNAATELSAEQVPVIDVNSPPATKTKLDPDAYAVVVGVEKYRQAGIPAVDFAAGDARAMYSYLTGSMGFDAKNVVLLTDDQATKTDLEKNFGSWLKNRVGPKSRVFVYYAGHGSPNPETGQGYLMPYEADPAYLEDTAYPLAKLYASLGKLPTKDVTVVLDACFSGQGNRSLIAKGTRPLVSVVQSKAEPNTVVLAAAGSNQVSASYPEARHGLLTYYLLAGLHGEADARHDGQITSDELISYVRPAVERAAKLQNVEQTPSLISPPEAASRPWIVLTPKR